MAWTTIETIQKERVEAFAEFGIKAHPRGLGCILLSAKGAAEVLRLLREQRETVAGQLKRKGKSSSITKGEAF